MKKIEPKNTSRLSFSQLTNKSKRKVYKEICKRFSGNKISGGVDFDELKHIPKIASSFFETYPHIFNSYKLKIYTEC